MRFREELKDGLRPLAGPSEAHAWKAFCPETDLVDSRVGHGVLSSQYQEGR